MTSDKARELFSEHLEGTLSAGLKQAFERRLTEDPALAEEYRLFSRVYEALGSMPPVEAPADLTERVQRRLDRAVWEEKSKSRPAIGWLRSLAFGAAAVAIVTTGYVGYIRSTGTNGIQAGVTGNGGTLVAMPEIQLEDGKLSVRYLPTKDGELLIFEGGASGDSLPPPDATPIGRQTTEAGQAVRIPLEVKTDRATTLWVQPSDTERVVALFLSGEERIPLSGRYEGTLTGALAKIAAAHGKIIEATIRGQKSVEVDLETGLSVEECLARALDGTGYQFAVEGDLVRVR